MIDSTSPFRHLPTALERKQAMFLDGIRHAADLADLAYQRLTAELTHLALTQGKEEAPSEYTSPFLYAWAVVDAIDRLRSLLHLLPGIQRIPRTDGLPSFREQTEVLRSARNISDHLATRVDHIIANDGAALGTLSWLTTVQSVEPAVFLSCSIVPGRISSQSVPLLNPAERERIVVPTDRVTLIAGEHSVCLSDIMPEMERVVRSLEESLRSSFAELGIDKETTTADILLVATLQLMD